MRGIVALAVGVALAVAAPAARAVDPFEIQEHYLFEVVNVLAWKGVEINVGVGEGLTAASNDLVAKTILGFSR